MKKPEHYHRYRSGSGRDRYLERVWGEDRTYEPTAAAAPWTSFVKPSEAELRETLTPLQFEVTQEDGTEPPFRNELWDEHRPGIYVDVRLGRAPLQLG